MASDPLIGTKLGMYDVIKLVGKGGMAGVYEGFQPSMNRTVAIKVMAQQLSADDSFIARFKNEAQTIAHLEHAHILPVYEYGEQDGTLYIVMRYLDAGTLEDRIGEKGMTIKDAVAMFSQIASALDYAHSKGVIHRDLKPSNVLVDKQGNTFLSDFGIAKTMEGGTSNLTGTGGVVGTPTYMSPEQGLGGTLDARSDIYALGVILFEMLTGKVPFMADNPMQVMLKHINDVPPAPSSINPAIKQGVENVVLMAMEKQPERRFSTATEMAEALRDANATGTFVSAKASMPSGTQPVAVVPPQGGGAAATMPAPVAGMGQAETPYPGTMPHAQAPGTAYPTPMPTPTGAMGEAEEPPYYEISKASEWLLEKGWIGTWSQAIALSLATFLALSRLTPGDAAQNVILSIIPGILFYGLFSAPIPGALIALGIIFVPLIAHSPTIGLIWLVGVAIAGMQMTSREMMLFAVTLILSSTPIGWLIPLAGPWWFRTHRVAFGAAMGVIFAGLFAVTLNGWPTGDGLLPKPEDTSGFSEITISDFDTSYIGLLDGEVWSTWFTRPQAIIENIQLNVQALGTYFITERGFVLLIVAAAWAIAAFVSVVQRKEANFLMRSIGIGAGAVVLILGHIFHAWANTAPPNLFYLLGIGIGCAVISFLVTQWPIQAPPPPRPKKKRKAEAAA